MKLYIIIIIIVIIAVILLLYSNNDDKEYYSYKPISENSYRKIIYPKSPIDARNDLKNNTLNNNLNIENSDYIIIPKIKLSNVPMLPPGFTAVYDQDETLTDVIEQDEMYKEDDILKTRKVIIQKRYKKESKGEAIARKALEDIYHEKFERIRPDFLKYINNKNLEIDCWCDKLKIGLEYNGKQHYEFTPPWHTNQESFINQIQRDTFKYDKFNELGYYLITVPYNVDHKMIRLYIEYYLPENVYKREISKNKNNNLLDL